MVKEINWKAVGTELVGSMVLEFLSAGAVIASSQSGSLLVAALGLGLSLAVVTWMTLGLSGAQLNPSITLAVAVTGKRGKDFGPLEILMYFFAQFGGAILGAIVLRYCIPLTYTCDMDPSGQTKCDVTHILTFLVRGTLSVNKGVVVFTFEFFCTFALVWVYFATVVDPKSYARNLAPLAIGTAMIVGVLTEGPWTGAGMNPARIVAPAVAFGTYSHCLSPLSGTFLGGVSAGMLYSYLFMFDNDIPDVYRITSDPGEHEAVSYVNKLDQGEHVQQNDAEHGYQTRWDRYR